MWYSLLLPIAPPAHISSCPHLPHILGLATQRNYATIDPLGEHLVDVSLGSYAAANHGELVVSDGLTSRSASASLGHHQIIWVPSKTNDIVAILESLKVDPSGLGT